MRKQLSMNKYQKLAQRTSPDDGHDRIDNGVLGLIGETGELVDEYKKWQYQSGIDAPMPAERFVDELGDVLWYLAELAAGMGKTMGEIAGEEFADLDKRAAGSQKRQTMRAIVTGLSGRAACMNRAIRSSDNVNAQAQFRWMLMGCARLAWMIGYDLETIAAQNVTKLRQRYPEGFDPEISMGRYR